MSARTDREYADRVAQARAFDHQVAVQNGTLEPRGERIAREFHGAAVVSLILFMLNSFKG